MCSGAKLFPCQPSQGYCINRNILAYADPIGGKHPRTAGGGAPCTPTAEFGLHPADGVEEPELQPCARPGECDKACGQAARGQSAEDTGQLPELGTWWVGGGSWSALAGRLQPQSQLVFSSMPQLIFDDCCTGMT